MTKIEREILEMDAFAKKTKNKKLRLLCKEMKQYLADDGTPGLGQYLWDNYIVPNIKPARQEYQRAKQNYHREELQRFYAQLYKENYSANTNAACITAMTLAKRRRRGMAKRRLGGIRYV